MGVTIDGTPIEAFKDLAKCFHALEVRKAYQLRMEDLGLKLGETKFLITGIFTSKTDGRSCGRDNAVTLYGIQFDTVIPSIDSQFTDFHRDCAGSVRERGFCCYKTCIEIIDAETGLSPDCSYYEYNSLEFFFESIKNNYAVVELHEYLTLLHSDEEENSFFYKNYLYCCDIEKPMMFSEQLDTFIKSLKKDNKCCYYNHLLVQREDCDIEKEVKSFYKRFIK